jgi:hypothetical protein
LACRCRRCLASIPPPMASMIGPIARWRAYFGFWQRIQGGTVDVAQLYRHGLEEAVARMAKTAGTLAHRYFDPEKKLLDFNREPEAKEPRKRSRIPPDWREIAPGVKISC